MDSGKYIGLQKNYISYKISGCFAEAEQTEEGRLDRSNRNDTEEVRRVAE